MSKSEWYQWGAGMAEITCAMQVASGEMARGFAERQAELQQAEPEAECPQCAAAKREGAREALQEEQ